LDDRRSRLRLAAAAQLLATEATKDDCRDNTCDNQDSDDDSDDCARAQTRGLAVIPFVVREHANLVTHLLLYVGPAGGMLLADLLPSITSVISDDGKRAFTAFVQTFSVLLVHFSVPKHTAHDLAWGYGEIGNGEYTAGGNTIFRLFHLSVRDLVDALRQCEQHPERHLRNEVFATNLIRKLKGLYLFFAGG
jgi:hypothetical protein